ncbi:hypothetical protein PRZ48_004881 [Zasmidium cellare]|uniref:Uncharacterized protein n=1 Tax=Zasmidium cellare TaxID=395010 RepID=A0ABR0ERU9_ZASCE|nr:hypothetical protein PRZ48_004881 [Zasmidium cellare]
MDAAAQAEHIRATRIVQHLVEQEALLADIRREATNPDASSIFALDFEQIFAKPDSAETIQPDGNGRNDLSQVTEHYRYQTHQTQTPMERFLAVSRSSDPCAPYASLRMAEMRIPEGIEAHASTRAWLLQQVSTQHAAYLTAQCVGDRSIGASSELSKARSEPTSRRRIAQIALAKGALYERAQSV